MNILSSRSFETLPRELSENLLFLRGQRDHLAREIASVIVGSPERIGKLLDDIATYNNPQSAFGQLRFDLVQMPGGISHIDALEALLKVSVRIARIEREQCGIDFYENDLLHDARWIAPRHTANAS